MDACIFKQYDIRGVYGEQLKEEDAWRIGYATAQVLPTFVTDRRGELPRPQSVCVGRDMRTHGRVLENALIEGIRSAGMDVIDVGMIDTPQVYFAINYLGTCGGVQVTASHNPVEYNGFKISGPEAIPIGADNGLQEIKRLALALSRAEGTATGHLEQQDLVPEYRKHVLQFLAPTVTRKKVAIDASNGTAGKVVPLIFDGAPIEILRINFEHTGKFVHDPDPLKERNLAQLKAAVREEKCDFGLCLDGDADRLVMVDEKGDTVTSDLLMALLVPRFLEQQPKSVIVYNLCSSRVVAEEIAKYGGTPRRERVGHVFMKKTMRESHAVFGGEPSGHFYYRDNYYADSAMITVAHVLNAVSEADVPVSELIRPLRRYSRAQELNFRVENKQRKMEELARRYSKGQIDYLDGVTVSFEDWWFNCRPSNTEPLLRLNLEAKTADLLQEKLAEMEQMLGKPVA